MKTKILFLALSLLIIAPIYGQSKVDHNKDNESRPEITRDSNNSDSSKDSNIIELPVFPEISYTALDENFSQRRNRYFIIDAHPDHDKTFNNGLMKRKKARLTKASALHQNGSLSVFLRNYNPEGEETFIVTIQHNNFSYEYDVQSLFKKFTDLSKREREEVSILTDKIQLYIGLPIEDDPIKNLVEKELKNAMDALKELECLNLNDLARVNAYKKDLRNFYERHPDNFNKSSIEYYYLIMSWSFKCISLTPISIALNDGDETEIWITQQKNKIDNNVLAGRYQHVGGMSVNLYSSLFLTWLTNNEIYTIEKDIKLNDGTTQKELRAFLENDQQISVGVGVNAEVSFRTGHSFRPTWNVGLFVPLETELTPIIATGPGFTIRNKYVNLNFNGGLAFGQVDQIAGRYRDIDLRQFPDLTNQNLVRKVWDSNWYFGLGINFNLTGSK